MKPHFTQMFSQRAHQMRASEIRELLKLTQKSDIISFAGGLPNPEAFPREIVEQLCVKVVRENANNALQYGATEGVTELRAELARRMRNKGMSTQTENVLVTHGSQQGLTLLSMVFLEKGDIVVTTEPAYMGGFSAFRLNMARIDTVPMTDQGMDLDALEKMLHHGHRHGQDIKFIYLSPTFDNPTGATMPEANRKRLLEIAEEYDILIVEDDPYSDLRYKGEHLKPIAHYDKDGRVIYLGTLSKVLCPGFRVAWMAGHPDVINKLSIAKQPLDLCTNSFGQFVASEYLTGGYIDEHLNKIRALYSSKMEVMLQSMAEHFPEGTTWSKPEGGMFTWVTLPKNIDAKEMFPSSLAEKVAYVTGSAFFPNGGGKNNMRLNFSYSREDIIREGIKRLGKVIKAEMAKRKDEPATTPPVVGP